MRNNTITISTYTCVLLQSINPTGTGLGGKKNILLNTKEVSNFHDYNVKLENMIYVHSAGLEMSLAIYYIISYILSSLFKKLLDIFGGLKSC